MPFLFLVFSYFLGSVPSGFLISKFSGKNILEIGWRKTSGSNVFKEVGKWRGVLTGALDVGKGFLAVWLAQNLGLSVQIQAISGVAAVCGHNWSIFLNFAGGRGIGTFVGAFLALSPNILGFSLIPLIFSALIWNASIGTILFFITAIVLAVYFNQFGVVGFFTLISLTPIFIKRLSPIEEIFLSPPEFSEKFGRVKKKELIRNRLIFDADIARFDLRIKKIIKKLTKT